jgi:tRNA modification GTPase
LISVNTTIAAISTAHSPGAIGIIRVSGSEVLYISTQILKKKNQPLTVSYIQNNSRKSIYCEVVDDNVYLDQILYVFFPNPHSYTGEDMCELYLHGNPILLNKVLSLIFSKGAKPAKGGEFTKRAVLNGKLDLTAAESISRVITARSKYELELARKNVFGEIHKLSSKIRSQLVNLKAECEAEIDFSTEDLTFDTLNERKNKITGLHSLIKKVLENSDRASSVLDHSRVVLYGAPNTGKSSLLNAILGKERAIISDIPGTTRDYLSESVHIEGIPIQLIDTAGIRYTEDHIEKLGIERSEKEFENADIKLFVIDTSVPPDENFLKENIEQLKKSILVANKIDIQHSEWKNILNLFTLKENLVVIEVSSKTGEGIDNLVKLLSVQLKGLENPDDCILLEERNRYHFETIYKSLSQVIGLINIQAPPEIYIKEIDVCLEEIGQVNGRVDTEEVLGRIFSKFCVGK